MSQPFRSTIDGGVLATLFVTLLAVFAVPPAPAHAQHTEIGAWVGYGSATEVTTGITICTAADCGPSWMSRPQRPRAPAGGLDFRIAATDWLAFRAGLSLIPKGHGVGRDAGLRVAALYLELPVLLDVRLARIGPAELRLGAGVAPAALLSCHVRTVERQYPFRSYDTPCAEPSPVTGTEYGPAVGHDFSWLLVPGIRIPFDHGSLDLEVRVIRGLLDLKPADGGITRNRAYSVSVGYGWRL